MAGIHAHRRARATQRSTRWGAISLVVAVTGMVAVELLRRAGIGPPHAMRILAGCFEAGTIGGLAAWIAVTALFRRVPIPILGRHTNLLVERRAEFTRGIVDVVQNRWLAPDVVRARLATLSASNLLVGYLRQ